MTQVLDAVEQAALFGEPPPLEEAGAKYSHAELVRRAARWLRGSGASCVLVVAEYRTTFLSEIPDAIGWTCHGGSVLVECKATRADFLADKSKPHRALGMGQRRYFLCPANLIRADEVPEGWGLLYVSGSGCRSVRRAPVRAAFDDKAERGLLLNIARRATNYKAEPFVMEEVLEGGEG